MSGEISTAPPQLWGPYILSPYPFHGNRRPMVWRIGQSDTGPEAEYEITHVLAALMGTVLVYHDNRDVSVAKLSEIRKRQHALKDLLDVLPPGWTEIRATLAAVTTAVDRRTAEVRHRRFLAHPPADADVVDLSFWMNAGLWTIQRIRLEVNRVERQLAKLLKAEGQSGQQYAFHGAGFWEQLFEQHRPSFALNDEAMDQRLRQFDRRLHPGRKCELVAFVLELSLVATSSGLGLAVFETLRKQALKT